MQQDREPAATTVMPVLVENFTFGLTRRGLFVEGPWGGVSQIGRACSLFQGLFGKLYISATR